MLRAFSTAAFLFIAALLCVSADAASASENSRRTEVRRKKNAKSYLPVEMKSFNVRGQPFTLVQRKNSRGQVIEQYLITKNRTEISRDPKGRGFLHSWELVTPGRRIQMYDPRQGHFSMMDVEQVTKNFIYNMSFFRTKAGKYRLLKMSTRKFGPQFSTMPVEVIAGCHSTEPELQKVAGEMNEIVKAANPSDLDSVISGKILHESCKNEPFDDRTQDILAAIRTVFKSDNDWSSARAKEVMSDHEFQKSVGTQGTYLQCLRYHELDTHASRIEAALAGYIGAQDSKHKPFPWEIRCSTASYYRFSKVYGEYTPAYGAWDKRASDAPIINFVDNQTATGALPKRGKDDEPYAKTFFHEMLHYSLIGDGELLDSIMGCCVPNGDTNSTDPHGPACRKLDGLVRKQELTQQVVNQFRKLFGEQDFGMLVAEVAKKYGTEQGQQMMWKVFSDIGQAYSDLEEKGKCNFSTQSSITESCLTQLKLKISDVVNEDLKGQDALREAILKKFDIKNAAANSYCVPKAQKASEFFQQDLRQQMRQVAAWLLPEAWAYDSEADKLFCQYAMEEPKAPADLSLRVPDYKNNSWMANQKSVASTPELNDAMRVESLVASKPELNEKAGQSSGSVSSGDSSSSSQGGQKHYDLPEVAGPRRTHYSEDPTERAAQIEKAYRNESTGYGDYFNRLAAKLESVTVPEAKAQEPVVMKENSRVVSTSSQERTQAPVNSSASVDGGGNRMPASTNYNVRVPAFDVPDPFQSAGPLGTGPGVALAAASAPGSVNLAPSRDRQSAESPASARVSNAVNAPSSASSVGSRVAGFASLDGATLNATGSAPVNGKPVVGGITGSPKNERSPANRENERAAAALLAHLQQKFSKIKHELQRPSVIKAMQRHFIQVIDDEGRVFGSGFPKTGRKLIYNREKDRLEPEAAKAK